LRRTYLALILLAVVAATTSGLTNVVAAPAPRKTPYPAAVLGVTVIKADQAATMLRALYPRARIRVDRNANAIIVVASPDDVNAMRTVLSGIDVKNPLATTATAVPLHNSKPADVIARLRALFPHARFTIGPNKTVLVVATQLDLTQINAIVSAIDTAPASPPPPAYPPAEAVRVMQRRPRDVAHAVAVAVPGVRVMVSGSDLLLSGPSDRVAQAKTVITQLDQPQPGSKYTQVYRLHSVDAQSVADLFKRSFSDIAVQVDKDLNAITVYATATEQQRIAGAVTQLDGAAGGPEVTTSGGIAVTQPGTTTGTSLGPGGEVEVYSLKAAVPGLNGAPSTTATDVATTVTQALSSQAPDLKITVPPNSSELVLTGSQYSLKLAKDLINQLDTAQPLVVMDTEVLEVDETVAKNLGLQLTQPVVSTTFTEGSPLAPASGGTPPATIGIQPFSRTPLSLGLTLNLLIQNGKARILSDPRITTVSGRTASIRAGDTLSILTTAGGGAGTIATTQLQSFQTGVTLDITPLVNAGNYVTVTLHPTVNNLSGILNGVPQISTRDTTTTVGLQADQTLVIGGLIEDTTNRTENKLPFLGDIPLIGKLFRNESYNLQRNELIITVTPHIVEPGNLNLSSGPALPAIPTAQPLPTLPPGTVLPPPVETPLPTPLPTPIARQPPAQPAGPPPPQPLSSPVPAGRQSPTPPAPAGRQSSTASPRATSSASPSAGATPGAVPTAFAQVNVFTYGQAPQNNFAKPTDPVQIYYVQVSPTVLKSGTSISVSAITSSNVSKVTLGYGTFTHDIAETGAGQFQATYNFDATGIPYNTSGVQLILKAQRNDGSMASIPVPITLTQ